jgi:branched-chain amino acid transport system ATP-binding protein
VTALLDARDVVKRFSGITALDHVSMHVDAGEIVGLIGPNGAGKTTFFNCLLGILRPDEGTVRFDGIAVTGLPVHRRALLGFGRTFQRIELFGEMTVREHLLVALRAHEQTGSLWKDLTGRGGPQPDEIAACDAVLARLGLADVADAPIESLSLGRGRLVEVGRALMTEPKLLLLDEPSSGLDRSETEELTEVLGAVQRETGMAILLVEHDVEMVRKFVSRLYVLDFGKLLAEGETEAVLAHDDVRRAYLGETV